MQYKYITQETIDSGGKNITSPEMFAEARQYNIEAVKGQNKGQNYNEAKKHTNLVTSGRLHEYLQESPTRSCDSVRALADVFTAPTIHLALSVSYIPSFNLPTARRNRENGGSPLCSVPRGPLPLPPAQRAFPDAARAPGRQCAVPGKCCA